MLFVNAKNRRLLKEALYSNRIRLFFVIVVLSATNAAKGQYDTAAKSPGSMAIFKDSSLFVAWATGCEVTRGYMNVASPSAGYASAGTDSLGIGKADGQVISFGDGGYAIVTFANPVENGTGPDFAVFENSFDGQFLELGFVEVSSDGIHYVRFPSVSNTQDTIQTGTFGDTNPTKLLNLAGKYLILYGTPFDLDELKDSAGIDINAITHVKIIDVVGSIQPQYATRDRNGHIINDPWPTPFATCGFDLDAVGVIHQSVSGLWNAQTNRRVLTCYPNPVSGRAVYVNGPFSMGETLLVSMTNEWGQTVWQGTQDYSGRIELGVETLVPGVYQLQITSKEKVFTARVNKL